MCGRYSLTSESYDKFLEFTDMGYPFQVPSRFNIAPTQPVAVIRLKGSDIDQAILPDQPLPEKEGVLMRWGLIPHFAKEIATDRPMINARSETIGVKPSFRGPFRRRKCLVPADGFYEWKRGGVSPIPHHICLQDHEPFTFAAIWEAWTGPAGEDWIETVSLITKASKGKMKKLHHRAPVIVEPKDHNKWLRPADPPDFNIFNQLSSDIDEKLEIYEVSPYVNSARHDGEQCIKPATTDQFKLF
ncbi:MAG: SOS response-associated peptidase [Kordiimonadaceae bacterium]|jgi:putative SOS response-associated peptidase YedK|nr:SOS response-associated peptidase [Kordiimonadaceae bacterium]MBT6031022.1 SOS response-associated peptidase [Kordiimonadaceae bacterium]